MSLICLCVVRNVRDNEIASYTRQIEALAKHYGRGTKFYVDWPEPIIASISNDSLIINITDSSKSDNCEMFLLPDGWYNNRFTNKSTFRERMKFLQDISDVFIRKYTFELYLGESAALNPIR